MEARGREPLGPDLADIRAVTDLAGLLSEMARLQLQVCVAGAARLEPQRQPRPDLQVRHRQAQVAALAFPAEGEELARRAGQFGLGQAILGPAVQLLIAGAERVDAAAGARLQAQLQVGVLALGQAQRLGQ